MSGEGPVKILVVDDLGAQRMALAAALGELQQRQSAKHDSDLLDSASYEFLKFLSILLGDFDAQGWTTHTHVCPKTILHTNVLLESF